jgi:hypothetical protein
MEITNTIAELFFKEVIEEKGPEYLRELSIKGLKGFKEKAEKTPVNLDNYFCNGLAKFLAIDLDK